MSKTPSICYYILLLVATLGWSQTDYTIDVQWIRRMNL